MVKKQKIIQVQKNDIFQTPQYKETQTVLRQLYQQYKKFQHRNLRFQGITMRDTFKKWLSYYHQYCEEDYFNGVDFSQISGSFIDQSQFFKNIYLFKNLWPIRFGNRCLNRLKELSQQLIPQIITYIRIISDGLFQNKYMNLRQIRDRKSPFFTNLIMSPKKNYNFIIRIVVEKVPVFQKKIHKITRFQFRHALFFYDLVKDQKINYNMLNKTIQRMVKGIDINRSNQCCDQLVLQNKDKQKMKNSYVFVYTQTFVQDQTQFIIRKKGYPNQFKPQYISNKMAQSFIYDNQSNRWITKQNLQIKQIKKIAEYQKQINRQMLAKFADFSSAKKLVQLLVKIPNFGINFTQQEKDVIGQNGNVLVIGRSGTGKTTCSVLRMFSMEMLFKIRKGLCQQKHRHMLEGIKFDPNQIDQTGQLRCIFATASPVLTNQIKRYYNRMKQCIKDQIQNKQKKLRQQQKIKRSAIAQIKEEQEISIQVIQEVSQINQSRYQQKSILKQQIDPPQFDQQQKIQQHMQEDTQHAYIKLGALSDLQPNDFPGFYTIRSLIMMIDGSLLKPFFTRNKDSQTIDKTIQTNWHNQQKGVMMIDDYHRKMQNQEQIQQLGQQIDDDYDYQNQQELEHAYQRQLYLMQQQRKGQNKKYRGIHKKAFEIDYDYFARHFFPGARKYHIARVTDHICWTQICSLIKGSVQSHTYRGGYLPQKIYIQLSNAPLSKQQKLAVYQIFCQYQRWKAKIQAYDFMDFVNYVLGQLRFKRHKDISLHYLQIDQIQDLPHSVIYLLCQIVQQGIFFSGDTAQTIAKGVNFRFSDLNKLFNSDLQLIKPTTMQLTVNFRSHNNILQLANSVVSVIQQFFPKTIDRLKKERSNLNGPRPVLIQNTDVQVLFMLLTDQSKVQESKEIAVKPKLQFGCDQVIIVRDQQSKEKIPKMLQHALCLTVYQAKGLQFQDVILYNFFSSCPIYERWSLIKHLIISQQQIDIDVFKASISKIDKEQKQQEFEISLSGVRQQGNKVYVSKVKSDGKIPDLKDFSQLASQLKLLYTAITRPRNTLLIYDDNNQKRKVIQNYWQKLKLIDKINLQKLVQEKESCINKELQGRIFKVRKTTKQAWKLQGIKMFKRKYFQQAIKCFYNASQQQLVQKSRAYLLAQKASKLYIQTDTQYKQLQIIYQKKIQINKKKKKLKEQKKESIAQFKSAGILFQKLGLFKQAGKCFYSSKDLEKAKQLFYKSNRYRQAAQCCYHLNQFKQSAQLYVKLNDYSSAIQSYEQSYDWQAIFDVLQLFRQKINKEQKSRLIQKYAPLFLAEQIQQIKFENDIQTVKPLVQITQTIEQQDSEQQQYQEQQQIQRQELIDKQVLQRKQVQKQEIKQRKMSQGQIQFKRHTSMTKQQQQVQYKITQQSFQIFQPQPQQQIDIISFQAKSQDIKSIQQQPKYGTFSIDSIKSISDIKDDWVQKSLGPQVKLSQYSVIGKDKQKKQKPRGMLIKTQGNIYAQDTVMRNIWKIFITFRQQLRSQLKHLKSKSSLLSQGKDIQLQQDQMEIDFDCVEPKLLALLLDTLQYFKVYKLCIFICNRYNLPQQLSRYILSIAVSYSPIAYQFLPLQGSLISVNFHRRSVLEKGYLGSVAIHSIFENINPQYFQSGKVLDEYLGKGLVLLGYFRKIIEFSNKKFKILSDFFEFYKFKQEAVDKVEQINIQLAKQPNFLFLPISQPRNQFQQQLFITSLQHLQWQLALAYINKRIYKNFHTTNKKTTSSLLPHPYFKCFTIVYQLIVLSKQSNLQIFCDSVNSILSNKKSSPAQFYDAISSSLYLLAYLRKQSIKIFFILTPSQDLALWLLNMKQITKLSSLHCGRHTQLVDAVVSQFRIRLPNDYFLGREMALIHRSCPFMHQLLGKKLKNIHCFFAQQQLNVLLVPTRLIMPFILNCLNNQLKSLIDNLRLLGGERILYSKISNKQYSQLQKLMVVVCNSKNILAFHFLTHSYNLHPRILEKAIQLSNQLVKQQDGRLLGLMGLSLHYKEVGQKQACLISHFTGLQYLKFQRIQDYCFNMLQFMPFTNIPYRIWILTQCILHAIISTLLFKKQKTLQIPQIYIKLVQGNDIKQNTIRWKGQVMNLQNVIKQILKYAQYLICDQQEQQYHSYNNNQLIKCLIQLTLKNIPQIKHLCQPLLLKFEKNNLISKLDYKQLKLSTYSFIQLSLYLQQTDYIQLSQIDYHHILVQSSYRITAANVIKRCWKKYKLNKPMHSKFMKKDQLIQLLGIKLITEQSSKLLKDIQQLRITLLQFYHKKTIFNSIDFHFIIGKLIICDRLFQKLKQYLIKHQLNQQIQLIGQVLDKQRQSIANQIKLTKESIKEWDADPKWKKEVEIGKKRKMVQLKWLDKGMFAKRKGKKQQAALIMKKQRLQRNR